ncbi:hypothetical protein RP20_CCG000518 [Aedes albopictus]|nr:hypothetical protein RP20_CCG000518 [Aedes albopictus]
MAQFKIAAVVGSVENVQAAKEETLGATRKRVGRLTIMIRNVTKDHVMEISGTFKVFRTVGFPLERFQPRHIWPSQWNEHTLTTPFRRGWKTPLGTCTESILIPSLRQPHQDNLVPRIGLRCGVRCPGWHV